MDKPMTASEVQYRMDVELPRRLRQLQKIAKKQEEKLYGRFDLSKYITICPKNRKLLKSSKVRKWFDVALRAIEKEVFPPLFYNPADWKGIYRTAWIDTKRNEWNPKMSGWVNDDPDAIRVKQ